MAREAALEDLYHGLTTMARRARDMSDDLHPGLSLVAYTVLNEIYLAPGVRAADLSAHFGLDMAVPEGTPIHAPAPGIVTFAESGLVLTGGTVLIDHGHGLSSSFLHMSRLDVKVGDKIAAGQVIGAAGMTGRATGPHVHWGFNWFEVRLDPALLPKPEKKN